MTPIAAAILGVLLAVVVPVCVVFSLVWVYLTIRDAVIEYRIEKEVRRES